MHTYLLFLIVMFWQWPLSSAKKESIERTLSQKLVEITCPNTTRYSILHIKATHTKHKNDVVHYVFTAVLNVPTIFVKHVLSPISITFNDANICNNKGPGFSILGEDKDITGIMLTKVFSYDDKSDTVSLNDVETGPNILLSFKWGLDLKSVTNGRGLYFGRPKLSNGTGLLTFEINTSTKDGHGADLPHNPINANISEFTLTMRDLPVDGFTDTRYAVEVTFFSTHTSESNGKYTTKKSIDDEYTPGIFKIWSTIFPVSGKQAFCSWKPVAYVSSSRTRDTQSLAYNFAQNNMLNLNGKLEISDRPVIASIVSGITDVKYYSLNVTFGISKDGFFKATNYLSWVGMIGYGTPPVDSISQTVTIVIAVGLGAPAVVILAGILVLLVRRVRFGNNKSSYQKIN